MGEWFDTGFKMPDKKTPRTVYALDELQCEEFLKKGWKAVKKKAAIKKKPSVRKKVLRGSSAVKKSAKAGKDE